MKKCVKILGFLISILVVISVFTVCTLAADDCEHDWYLSTVIRSPTCSTYGRQEWTCFECDEKEYRLSSFLEHNFEEGYCSLCGVNEATVLPTIYCDHNVNDDGYSTFSSNGICTYCSYECPHDIVKNCTSYTNSKHTGTCIYCGTKATVPHELYGNGCLDCDFVEECNHDWDVWEVVTEPTCGVAGRKERECLDCGTVESRVIARLVCTKDDGTVIVKATCDTAGTMSYSCVYCDDFMGFEDIPALGHDLVNGVCSRCDYGKENVDTTKPDETTKVPDETTKVPDETTKTPDETTSTPVKDHEHNLSAWKKLNEKQHVSECQDPDCAYKLSKDHLDKDFDKKCDNCGCDYSEDISLKRALGIALGAAVGFGILYMVAAIVRSGKER